MEFVTKDQKSFIGAHGANSSTVNICMDLNILLWRSLKTRVTLFTLVVFVIGIWSLALCASRVLSEYMQMRLRSKNGRKTVVLNGQKG